MKKAALFELLSLVLPFFQILLPGMAISQNTCAKKTKPEFDFIRYFNLSNLTQQLLYAVNNLLVDLLQDRLFLRLLQHYR